MLVGARAPARAGATGSAGGRLAQGMDELLSPTASGARAPPWAGCPTAGTARADVIEGDGIHTGDIPIQVGVEIAGSELVGRLRRHRAPAAGQRQLPARGHPLGRLLRGAGGVRSRYPGVGRRLRPGHGARAGGLPRERASAERGGRRQHRDVEPDRRRGHVGARRAAVDVPAHGQGTMNNVTFGTPAFTYYETLGGGQGGSPAGPGPSGVHVAMSNTLNTPIEALEREYPLRIERYALRRGTGGAGRHRGGDGVVRVYHVLEDCRLGLDDRAPPPPPAGRGGRSRWRAWAKRPERPPAAGQVQPRPARRRRARDPHPRRRRLGSA